MVKLLDTLLAVALAGATFVYAEPIVAECGRGLGKCPPHKPCCTQYGQCGIGAYCLGGCDPLFSTTLDSCVANPVCQNKHSTFESLDKVVAINKYLGDSSKYDWVAEGKPVIWDNSLLLTMERGSVGTVLSSTTYMWYGKVSATLKTSRGAGVVSSLILFSGVRDEIDYEWVGVELDEVQTNYYFQGIPDYTNGGKSDVEGGDTFSEWHTYEIDWKPESITWSVDGEVIRVQEREETWNETSKQYHYPQTPSRVQLSLWPGGLETNAEGTIEWAGGLIDWEHPDIQETGYYYVTIKDITVECYDPPKDARKEGSTVYIYDDESGLESSVLITDKPHILKSFIASGTDLDKVPEQTEDDKDDEDKPKNPEEEVETIPGLSGGGTSTGDYVAPGPGSNQATPDENDNGFSYDSPLTDFKQNVGESEGGASTMKKGGMALGAVFSVAVFLL